MLFQDGETDLITPDDTDSAGSLLKREDGSVLLGHLRKLEGNATTLSVIKSSSDCQNHSPRTELEPRGPRARGQWQRIARANPIA